MIITDKALQEIKRLNANQALRIKVQGGGCKGLTYKLDFEHDEYIHPKDVIITYELILNWDKGNRTNNNLKVVVDPKSWLYLENVTLDFTDGLEGKGFEFSNPNSKRNCACGASFNML